MVPFGLPGDLTGIPGHAMIRSDPKGALNDIALTWDGKRFQIDEIETHDGKRTVWQSTGRTSHLLHSCRPVTSHSPTGLPYAS